MTTSESSTYFRPADADTGRPLLTTYFTAALCTLGDAHLYDLEKRSDELAADVRDHLDSLGIPIRPTIKQGRVRVLQETDPDENGYNQPPEVYSTVMVFLTDAEPDDPRLEQLADGFHAERIAADVEFQIPTVESEEALKAAIAADDERGRVYVAKATVERAEAARKEASPFAEDMSELFD
jgi:hypothetical protein